MRFMLVGVCLVLTVSGCGGSEMSLTEYVDQLNAINRRALEQYLELLASPQGEVLVAAEAAQITDFTPEDLQVGLEAVIEIAVEVKEAADAIEPPEEVADLHPKLFDDKFTFFEEALATRLIELLEQLHRSQSSRELSVRRSFHQRLPGG